MKREDQDARNSKHRWTGLGNIGVKGGEEGVKNDFKILIGP